MSGPESTGKTTLCGQLAAASRLSVVPEQARLYLDTHGPAYDRADVVAIARAHMQAERAARGPVLFDTDAANLVLWFQDKGWDVPQELSDHLRTRPYDLVLLLYPDIDWAPDPLRENPDRGVELFHRFQALYRAVGQPYATITGRGGTRLERARTALGRFIAADYL